MKSVIVFGHASIRIILFIITFAGLRLHAQDTTLIKGINQALFPLDTSSYLDKNFLPDDLFSKTSVIALGESTHGTKEFYSIKDYIIRNQVIHNSVKVIALENEFCSLIGLNNYLLDNTKPLDSLFTEFDRSGMFGIYFTKEVFNMLSWLKQYNLGKSDNSEKVQLFGLDMQDPYSITQTLIERFSRLKTLDVVSYEKLVELNRLYYPRKEVDLSNETVRSYINLADKISLLVRQHMPSADTTLLLHLSNLLTQTIDLREKSRLMKYKGDKGKYREKRDAFMAENVIWIQNNVNTASSKMVIWAHNGHIAHAKLEGRYRMGYYLKSYFKDKYYATDFLFNEGWVRIFDYEDTKKYKPFFYPSSTFEKSIEYCLKKAASPLFFLDLSNSKTSSISDLFDKNKYQRVIGAEYQSIPKKDYFYMPVLECFDGLIFIKKTSAAENVK